MKDLLLDIRYALRVLWKSPAFTVVALVTLMLGIGANVVVFGLVNAVLLRPLDVSDPKNLYQLRLGSWTNWKLLTTSYPAFEDYQRRNTTFSAIAGFDGYCSATLHSDNIARSVSGYAVTGNYFDMLGVQPQVGRLIHAEDVRGTNSAPYIVLSDSLWRSAFNADLRVIGKTVRLNKDPFTVLGVAPPQFHGTEQFDWPDYFIPIVNYFDSDYLRNRTGHPLTVLGRLKPGVTPQQAAENLTSIAAQLAKEYPQTDTGLPLRLVRPGLYADTGDVIRDSLYSVTGLALLVLAAACANLATLFTARAADRNRELAVRVALGASRWRLMRQLLTEASIVSLLGGTAGLLIAAMLLRVLDRGSLPSFLGNSPFGHVAVSVDARVYLVALVLTFLSGLLFGMIPARQVRRSSPLQAMKSGAVDSMPLRRFTLHDLLLGAQITICTLMACANRSLRHGGLQCEPPNERVGHPRGIRRAREACDERGGGSANRTARCRIVSRTVMGNLRQPVTGADCLSGESARSGSRHRRGANDGAAGDCSVRHSSAASACRRSIQTLAGRVRQVNTLHVSDHWM